MTASRRARLGSIRPTGEWLERFQANRERPPRVPFSEASLTDEERRDVLGSIQEFQLGESSAGGNLRRLATSYARRVRDPEYVEAIEAFIAEEQAHAGWLGRYLDAVGARRLRRSALDQAFRRLRKLGGLETALRTLLTAELVAKLYYRALGEATNCPALRVMCERILADERAHVEFHCERLFLMGCMRPAWRNRARGLLHRALFEATLRAVWLGHGRVFRRSGWSYRGYLESARGEFDRARAWWSAEAVGASPAQRDIAPAVRTMITSGAVAKRARATPGEVPKSAGVVKSTAPALYDRPGAV